MGTAHPTGDGTPLLCPSARSRSRQCGEVERHQFPRQCSELGQDRPSERVPPAVLLEASAEMFIMEIQPRDNPAREDKDSIMVSPPFGLAKSPYLLENKGLD